MTRPRIGINGFGRIGRVAARQILANDALELVVVSDIIEDVANVAYLYNYDSNYGHAKIVASLTPDGRALDFGHAVVSVLCERNMANVPWAEFGIDVLIDSSGIEANLKDAPQILEAGVRHIVVTNSPQLPVDKTVVLGVNDGELDPARHKIISSSICDTNAIAHMVKALDDRFGVESGFVTTLHPWLSYQNLVDGPVVSQSDPRHFWNDYSLGRASSAAIIPKNTTAVSALRFVLPKLADRLKGFSYRVPTAIVCSTDMAILLDQDVDAEMVNCHLREYFAESPYVKINSQSLISKDYEANPASVVIDLQWTMVSGKRLVKLVGWYDNEWGYCARLTELALRLGRRCI